MILTWTYSASSFSVGGFTISLAEIHCCNTTRAFTQLLLSELPLAILLSLSFSKEVKITYIYKKTMIKASKFLYITSKNYCIFVSINGNYFTIHFYMLRRKTIFYSIFRVVSGSLCRITQYCSVSCQRKDSDFHRFSCGLVAKGSSAKEF